MPYDSGGATGAPAAYRRVLYRAPVRRAPIPTSEQRALVSGSRGDYLTAEQAKRIAPGIRPELIDQLYSRGLRVSYGPTGGGWYTPSTREISLGNVRGQTENGMWGYRGVLEHELRHGVQHIGNVPVAALTNTEYWRGRLGMQLGGLSENMFNASPYLNVFARAVGNAGRIIAPPSPDGIEPRAEAFANYGEPAYAGLSRSPYMNVYPQIHADVQSLRSLTAQSERMTAQAWGNWLQPLFRRRPVTRGY